MSPERLGGVGAILDVELARAVDAGERGHRVVLVEGESDRRAVAAVAARFDRDLAAEGVEIIAIAGATNIQRFLALLGPSGHDVPLAGLCDAREEDAFRDALRRAGIGSPTNRAELASLGFFVCVEDLEDELIRALGAPTVLEVMVAQGHTRRFHSFQNQPDQREKTLERQIWRWLGNHKIRYAPLLVAALDLEAVPAPLQGLMDLLA